MKQPRSYTETLRMSSGNICYPLVRTQLVMDALTGNQNELAILTVQCICLSLRKVTFSRPPCSGYPRCSRSSSPRCAHRSRAGYRVQDIAVLITHTASVHVHAPHHTVVAGIIGLYGSISCPTSRSQSRRSLRTSRWSFSICNSAFLRHSAIV